MGKVDRRVGKKYKSKNVRSRKKPEVTKWGLRASSSRIKLLYELLQGEGREKFWVSRRVQVLVIPVGLF